MAWTRCQNLPVTEFDPLAAHYDATRGGEQRGDEYAEDIRCQVARRRRPCP